MTALMAIGTAGYALIEGWTPMESLYMTFITLSTIGYGEVYALSSAGQLFTIALATVGIGTFATIATRTVQLVVATAGFRDRRMQRRIDALSGHYIICGYGRLGERIAADLQLADCDLVVVDRSDERAQHLDAAELLYVRGDAEEESVLQAAGIEKAAGLVLVLPEDADNVFVSLTARELRPRGSDDDLFIVARTNEQTSVNKLRRAGADKVVSPLEIGADRIAQTILRPRVGRFMEQVLGMGTMDFDLEEITVHPGSDFEGQSLLQVDLRRRYNTIVVGILREQGQEWEFNPDASAPIHAGDILISLGSPERIVALRQAAGMTA